MEVINIIEKLKKEQTATKEELVFLLENITDEELKVLRRKAQVTAIMNFRKDIYIRGLIEISNYCKKRLPLLRDTPLKQKRRALPPDTGADFKLLRPRLRARF